MNRILSEHEVGYTIRPPDLICQRTQESISVEQRMVSLGEQAQEIIQQSLEQSEQSLLEGRDRHAVQEILWLLETISTAFQGLNTETGTIEGKYFNKIADALGRHHKGQAPEQILTIRDTKFKDFLKHGKVQAKETLNSRSSRDQRSLRESLP